MHAIREKQEIEEIIEELICILKQNKERFDFAAKQQIKVWKGEIPEKQPLLLNCSLDKIQEEKIPLFNNKEIHYDSKKMLLSGLRETLAVVNAKAEAVPSVRANMGCGIFPTLLGVTQMLFDDKMPWVIEHLSKDTLKRMSPEDIKISDEFKIGLDHMAYMAEMLEGTGCMIFPMDLQGAYDTAHIVYGDQIFYDMYDDPEFVHHLLELSCEAIFIGMEECLKIIPGSDEKIAHYNSLVIPREKGGIKISEDTPTLLSKSQIDEFVVPYMRKILEHFGGGYIHYCGKNPNLFEAVMNEPFALGINFGNPEMHDMEYVLRKCAELDKIYYGYINKENDMPYEEYFRKYLTASRKGKISLMFLQYTCDKDNREEVMNAWSEAIKI